MTDSHFAGPKGLRLDPLLGEHQDNPVRQVKVALNRLGFYMPDSKTGFTDADDAHYKDALYAFQRKATIPFGDTGIRPGSATLRILNQELARQDDSADWYIWHTVEDNHVRPDHAARDGQRFQWSHPPKGGNPGEDYNCRCWAEPVTKAQHPWMDWVQERQAEREAYPDAINPTWSPFDFLGSGIALGAKALSRNIALSKVLKSAETDARDIGWTFGKHKSEVKWGNQMTKRDWTDEEITKTLQKGKKFPAPNKVHPENTATRFEYEGRYVVRDDQTKEIIQISGHGNFLPNALGD